MRANAKAGKGNDLSDEVRSLSLVAETAEERALLRVLFDAVWNDDWSRILQRTSARAKATRRKKGIA